MIFHRLTVSAPRIVALLSAWMIIVCCGMAQRRNTTRRHLKAAGVVEHAAELSTWRCDTVVADTTKVRFSGYSKTLRAIRESVFVTNLTDSTVDGVIFQIQYYDTKGRMMHQVRQSLPTDIPPRETRKIDFPTWDRQFIFYYARSPRPRVSAVPYTVKILPDTLLLSGAD